MTIEEVLKKHGVAQPPCGASVGEGWVPLVDNLIQELIALGWDRHCEQIKEKFGGLRFYIGQGSEEVRNAIHRAEAMSYKICELCSAPGQVGGKGWLTTLCTTCRKEDILG